MNAITPQSNNIGAQFQEFLADYKHLPCGAAIVKNDTTSTLIEANPAYYRIIGHTKEQLWEKHQNRITDILLDNVYDILEKQSTESDYEIEFDLRIYTADGQVRWIHDIAHYNAASDVFFILVTDVTDKLLITGSSLSYEAFQTKHEILAYMAKYTSEHIVVTDAVTDEVVYMNPKAMKLLDFHHESDWLGKNYCDIMFGEPENIHPDYNKFATEDTFTVREYYNKRHGKYAHAEAKIITIPALNRKMRLNILTDISDHKRLEYKIALHKTLHECIDALFTSTTSNSVSDTAYYDMLKQMKKYYHADRAFFYKFKEGTHEIEKFCEVFADGVKKVEHTSSMVVDEKGLRLMQKLSAADPTQYQAVYNTLDPDYQTSLIKLHSEYGIDHFSCVVVNDAENQVIAFMGVTNPQLHEGNKELMELLSRFILMFIEHQDDQEIKEEAYALEGVSKAILIEKCTKNFQNVDQAKDKVNDTLDALCEHYDADCAVVLAHNPEDGTYSVPFAGGRAIPNLDVFAKQPSSAIKRWTEIFTKHSQFATDVDLDEPMLKALLKDNLGIHNFIASPVLDDNGDLRGLLFVINYKYMNRAHFMVHVVAKNVSDYIDRIVMHELNKLEPSTQLTNKVTTQHYISKLLEEGVNGALFVIDIDNFKRLNDTLGHQVGDQALIDFAVILKKIFRTTDIVGRIGGDEFMVFTPELTAIPSIETRVNQVLTQCKKSYEKDGITVEITASVGVCCADGKNRTFQPLYENADYALYISKKNGKNQYHIYSDAEYLADSTTSEDLRFYHNVVQTLKSAIEDHRFVVYYQPLYHVPSAVYTQAEALVRIEKPDGSLIYPNDFVGVAESTGMVVEMTYQIMEQVCRDFRKLLDTQPDTTLTAISVNVPYLQFTDPNMETRFLEILEKYKISPSQIKLEITERSIISDMDLMTKRMASMMEKGFDFELDDFGTDYSNLEMCVALPLDIIKLDRSLLLAASATDKGRHFFGHVLSGLHETGQHTIMEGVETQEQLDWAKKCNCEFIQGYYFSKPVDFENFEKILLP